jgi:ABC-type polysaccharide/polyol phosphate transport system ATPase subunit
MSDLDLKNVRLDIKLRGKITNVLDGVSFTFPREHMALVGDARANTVAVLDLLCRRLVPQDGQVFYRGRISWPLGHTGPFSVAVTGTQAISHFSILYGIDRELAIEFMISEFENPKQLNRPIYTWPKPLQNQFMMLMALIPSFDIYLVDGNIVVPGDASFTARFLKLFSARIKGCTALFTARQARVVKEMCQSAVMIKDGKLSYTRNVDEALKINDGLPIQEEISGEGENNPIQDDDFIL